MNVNAVNLDMTKLDSTIAGLGIRAELFEPVLNDKPTLGFLEAHSENFFGDSIARAKLLQIREDYAISLHGVGLSLGRADDLDLDHLANLKALVNEVDPVLVSEHLSWSAYSHSHLPDLLPLPLTEQALTIICRHIQQMQEALGRQILLENPSNYLIFDQLQIPEPEFLNLVAEKTGCGLLIDVNNIVVSATNLQRSPSDYIQGINSQYIGQYHLAGYTPVEHNGESILIDTHNQTVYPAVWELFQETLEQHGVRPTLFEWDSDFPEFSVLLDECQKATNILSQHAEVKPVHSTVPAEYQSESSAEWVDLHHLQQGFVDEILNNKELTPHAVEAHKPRIWIYQNNVYSATVDYLEAVFPAVMGVVGGDYFKQMARQFIKKNPPQQGNIHLYGKEFSIVIQEFTALKKMPYLSDLIAYEWSLHSAYYANNTTNLDLTALSQEELLTADVRLNDSVTMTRSLFPLYEIHRQSLPDYSGDIAIDLADSQDTLIVFKHGFEVSSKVLDENEKAFLQLLDDSENLLQAIEGVGETIEPESVSMMLSFVFEHGLLTRETEPKKANDVA